MSLSGAQAYSSSSAVDLNISVFSNESLIDGNYTGFAPRYGWWHIYITGVILGCLILCTIVGNVFVVAAIILEKNLQSVSNYLILSLAVADLMVATLVMPIAALYEISDKWWLGMELCDIWVCFDVLCCTASILHLVAIAIDRYWAVTNVDYIRRRTARRIILMIAIVWVISIIISIPARFYPGRTKTEYKKIHIQGDCTIFQGYAFTIFSTVGAFYLPMAFMLAIYVRIYHVARSRIRRKAFNKKKNKACSKPEYYNQTNKAYSTPHHAGNGRDKGARAPSPIDKDSGAEMEMDEGTTMVSIQPPTVLSSESSSATRHSQFARQDTSPELRCGRPTVSITAADGNTVQLSEDGEESSATSTSSPPELASDNHHSHLLATTAFTTTTPANHNSATDPKPGLGAKEAGSTASKGFHFKPPPSPFRKRKFFASQERDNSGNADGNSIDGTNDSIGSRHPARSLEAMKERLEHKRERKAARTLAIITGCFLLCWMLFFLNALCMPFNKAPILPGIWFSLAVWLGYFNSLLNPIIYTIFSPDFRTAFRKILFGRYHRQKIRR